VFSTRLCHLFVVRIWLEPGRTPAEGQWRGSVVHVPSGERRYFAEMEDLAQFVRMELGGAVGAEGVERGA
jgi:hypothetical protein